MNIQGSSSPPSGKISTDGQDTWEGSRTTDGRSVLQNGLRDNGEDQEDDQERDGAKDLTRHLGSIWPRLARDRFPMEAVLGGVPP